jgi:hypothetical protein
MDQEFYGKSFPTEDTTIIPSRNRHLVNFYVQQYEGFEIYSLPDQTLGLTSAQLYDDREWPRGTDGRPLYHRPITDRGGIKDGDRVIWKNNPFDYSWGEGVVRIRGGEFTVETLDGSFFGALAFGEDDRASWVCTCVCNAKALSRVDFS